MASSVSPGAFEGSAKKPVVALVDIDSFECQIYKRLYPEKNFWGEPWIVADQTGRIVSATHEAREVGISRDIRLWEAQKVARRQKIPLKVFKKPNDREKPDAKEVRYATYEIVDCLKEFASKYSYGVTIEYSSSDEFYLDLTKEVDLRISDPDVPIHVEKRTFMETEQSKISEWDLLNKFGSTFSLPFSDSLEYEKRLICGGLIMQEVNHFLFQRTKLIGSAGVGPNKLMAKIAVSLNKPNGITILPQTAWDRIGNELKIEKIPGFGGSFGSSVKEILGITTMKELASFELEQLLEFFNDDDAVKIFLKSRGITEDNVKEKFMTDEVSCGKSFNRSEITSFESCKYHIFQLIEEMIEDRLAEERQRHSRQPTLFRFTITYFVGPRRRDTRDEKPLTWTYSTIFEYAKTALEYCTECMDEICNDEKFQNFETEITVTRAEIRGKQFTPTLG